MAKENSQPTLCFKIWETDPSTKMAWPELVGMKGEYAEKRIKEEMLGGTVHIIPERSAVTADIRLDRVRIFVDSYGTVAHVPKRG